MQKIRERLKELANDEDCNRFISEELDSLNWKLYRKCRKIDEEKDTAEDAFKLVSEGRNIDHKLPTVEWPADTFEYGYLRGIETILNIIW